MMNNYKYIIGIDQSLSNTSVVLFYIKTNSILEIQNFNTKPFSKARLDLDSKLKNIYNCWYIDIRNMVLSIKDEIINWSEHYGFNSSSCIIAVEKPNEGTQSGFDIIYRLGYLFMLLNNILSQHYQVVNVNNVSAKSVYFQEDNKRMSKETLHEFFFDKRFKEYGLNLHADKELNNDDRDAIVLIVFMLYYLNIYTNNDKKFQQKLKNHYCEALKTSGLCYYCKYLFECKKTKVKIPKRGHKLELFENARRNILEIF